MLYIYRTCAVASTACFIATAAIAQQMTKEEIYNTYSNTTSLSSDGSHVNFYSPDGVYSSTQRSTGKNTVGKWYATSEGKICIEGKTKRCWQITQTKRKICFAREGKSACRLKSKFYQGNKTSEFLR